MKALIVKQAIKRNAIIFVHSLEGKFIGMGSGVAFAKNRILTVSHIFGKVIQPVIITVLFGRKKLTGKLIYEAGGQDGLAVIHCQADIGLIRTASPFISQQVLIYGNLPEIYDLPITTNVIRAVDNETLGAEGLIYERSLLVNGYIEHGFSGSGVYSSQGLVGVVWGQFKLRSLYYGLVVHIQDILPIIKTFTQVEN